MPTKMTPFLVSFVLILLVLVGSRAAVQPDPQSTTWERVYTESQAVRGRRHYESTCSGCHGDDLAGGEGRALVGDQFWRSWGEDRLASLYDFMRASMPYGAPGSLEPEAYLDLVAYILQRNDYPSGNEALTAERAGQVRVTRKEGPGPVPDFALVVVVGCLRQGSSGAWELNDASEPARTRNPAPSVDAERQRSEATATGPYRIQLMDALQPGAHAGHRMEVKGLLIRGAPDRLNVTSMQMLADRCER
jgi:mono/diheme cytochrome c family protein